MVIEIVQALAVNLLASIDSNVKKIDTKLMAKMCPITEGLKEAGDTGTRGHGAEVHTRHITSVGGVAQPEARKPFNIKESTR